MTRDQAKDVIVNAVTQKQGLKATELAAIREVAMLHFSVSDLLDELVEDLRLIELEYLLPDELGKPVARAKSFLLPAGTVTRVKPEPTLLDKLADIGD